MSFQPVIPLGGYAGWAFLNRTREVQQQAFDNSAVIARNVTYFEENIAQITSAEALVADRQLLQVALGAFGLGDDINNKYFLQKVLEDGTIDTGSLANRLSDKRYLEFAMAFGFGDFDTPRTILSNFPAEITDAYKNQQFEIAVGQSDPDLRLAMGLERALTEILATNTSDDGRWFLVMGQPPVRAVFEAALGLPSAFGALDLELQLTGFRDAASSRFGDSEITQFSDPEAREKLIRLFLLQADINGNSAIGVAGSAALTLLQNAVPANRLLG